MGKFPQKYEYFTKFAKHGPNSENIDKLPLRQDSSLANFSYVTIF